MHIFYTLTSSHWKLVDLKEKKVWTTKGNKRERMLLKDAV